ncbi:hypothetical protein BDZ89DRAFT_1072821 [Hymenopellis radicata]|nr:hypothetical protein BDZ89DRAFT_1072821 [Hymenopellis radicata]
MPRLMVEVLLTIATPPVSTTSEEEECVNLTVAPFLVNCQNLELISGQQLRAALTASPSDNAKLTRGTTLHLSIHCPSTTNGTLRVKPPQSPPRQSKREHIPLRVDPSSGSYVSDVALQTRINHKPSASLSTDFGIARMRRRRCPAIP